MVYFRIRAHCLAHKKEWKKEYDNIDVLKQDIFDQFQLFNINEECGIIVYYDENGKCDCLLDRLDILPTDGTTIFDLYVKRVWACCGVCFGPFDIIPTRLPLECTEKTCNVQYCAKCVDTICALDKNGKFHCTFCNQTMDRPQRNILLENIFLWKPYTMRYGGHSTERLETIFSGPNLSDAIHRMENRRTHIQALHTTLQMSLSNITEEDSRASQSEHYLIEAERLNDKLETFVTRLRTCERRIKSQAISFRSLVANYRTLLRDSICRKPSKQEAASFILLCERLSALENEAIERIKTVDEQTIINDQNLIDKYQANALKNIVIKESSPFVDDLFRDVSYRRTSLHDKQEKLAELYLMSSGHPFQAYYLEQHQNAIQMINSLDEYELKFAEFRDIYSDIDTIMFEYRDELTRKTINDAPDEHAALPTNEQMAVFDCSRLILISELLRSETDRLERENIFSRTTTLVNQWKQDQSIDPKIYDLFAAVEQDLLSLYDPSQSRMHLIPFRVGFIGNISVGKSSVVNYLRAQNSMSSSINRTLSPTAVGQSTVGSLQFDEQHLCSDTQTMVIIRYVDIEGCTNYNTKVQAASYFEQIRKADCDLYIILFTGQQGSFECSLEKTINEQLHRPCWFVRSKVDKEFDELFNEQLGRRKTDYPDMDIDETEENELAELIIETIRDKSIEICQTSPDKMFLVNAIYRPNETNPSKKFNSQTHAFDIDLLSQRLIEFAQQSYRQERIKHMAIMVCAHAIGTCFRRRCIISFIKHQIGAGLSAMIIPWGDQIALVHTRFGIRLALGVQDRSSLSNRLFKTVDTFESLLLKYSLNIEPSSFKSDEFNYLKEKYSSTAANSIDTQNEYSKTIHLGRERKNSTIRERISSAAPAGAVACGIVGQKVAAATFAVSTVGYSVGASFFGLSLVAAIPIGLWTMRQSNKQIRDYLDDICADLLNISEHFIVAIINQQINHSEQA